MASFTPDLTEHWPSLISGMGLLLGVVLLGELVLVLVTAEPPEAFYIGIATSTPVIVGFVYGGHRLARSDLPPERYGDIGSLWVAGMVVAALLIFLINATLRPITAKMAIATIRWSAVIGGGVGLGIGVSHAKAVQQSVEAERARLRKEEVQRERDRLDKFASIISHDLQNPLHEASGYLELARQDDQDQDEHLNAVEDAHQRMSMLIDELLELARRGTNATDVGPVDLDCVAQSTWKALETTGGELVSNTEATIIADENFLRQLLENLFQNALDRGDESVTITVGVMGGGFYIADDGPGIESEMADRVFDSSYSTRDDGTGFGLYIVNQVVEEQGWDIAVMDSETGGARFELTGVTFAD